MAKKQTYRGFDRNLFDCGSPTVSDGKPHPAYSKPKHAKNNVKHPQQTSTKKKF